MEEEEKEKAHESRACVLNPLAAVQPTAARLLPSDLEEILLRRFSYFGHSWFVARQATPAAAMLGFGSMGQAGSA
jgi:hypothetical protein